MLLACAAPSAAQVWIGSATPKAGSVEISGGAIAAGGKDLADVSATLTRNPGTGSGAFELFRSDATLTSALGGQVRAGFYLSPAISLEGGLQYARPRVQVRLSADFEDAPGVTASETVTSYLFTGSFLYHFGRANTRVRPFIAAGGGHVRDLHEGNGLVETGNEFHAGTGFKSWFGRGRSKVGLRAELMASVRDGGVGAEDGRRLVPSAAFSLAYLF